MCFGSSVGLCAFANRSVPFVVLMELQFSPTFLVSTYLSLQPNLINYLLYLGV